MKKFLLFVFSILLLFGIASCKKKNVDIATMDDTVEYMCISDDIRFFYFYSNGKCKNKLLNKEWEYNWEVNKNDIYLGEGIIFIETKEVGTYIRHNYVNGEYVPDSTPYKLIEVKYKDTNTKG